MRSLPISSSSKTPNKPINSYFHNTIYCLIKEHEDNRPYVEVEIGNEKINGLLDSGASCSILGNGTKELIEKLHLKLYQSGTTVKTADGTQHAPNGYVNVPIIFNNKLGVLPFLFVPTITKQLILGIDFWKYFNIKPVVEVNEINIQQNIEECEHSLTPAQKGGDLQK